MNLFKLNTFKPLDSKAACCFLAAMTVVLCWLPISSLAQIAPVTTAPNITRINVFGDSLVDAGNIFNLTGLPPSPPYAQQLSNGPVWSEQLASELGLDPVLSTEALPNLQSKASSLPTEGINFALAGSLTSQLNSASPDLPGLQQQIADFSELSQLSAPDPNALYVLLAGGNDYNLAVTNPSAIASIDSLPDEVTDNLTNAASALIDVGARHLLIGNLPDLSSQPLADALSSTGLQNAQLLSNLSNQHNRLLNQKLTALAADSGVEIIQLDLAKLLTDVVKDPGSFGFTNVTDACLKGDRLETEPPVVCDNPDEYLFWDDQHPTVTGHRAIAQLALSSLIADPKYCSSPSKASAPIGFLGLMGGVGLGAIALRKR